VVWDQETPDVENQGRGKGDETGVSGTRETRYHNEVVACERADGGVEPSEGRAKTTAV